MMRRFVRNFSGMLCFTLFFYAEVNAQTDDSLKAAFTFSPSKICDSATVRFTDKSSPQDSIISWLWNFGDPKSGINNYSLIRNPSHAYSKPGTYVISLIVADFGGNVSTAEDSVTVGAKPLAKIGIASPTCVNREIQFLDSTISSARVTSWKWFFGEPGNSDNSSFDQNPTHIYKQSGTYTVHLIVSDTSDCTDTGEKTVTVHDNPAVNLSLSKNAVCPQAGDTIRIQIKPVGGFLNGTGIIDNFILGSLLMPNTIDTISYYFIDTFQCYGSDTEYLKVNKLPEISVSNDTILCSGDTIQLFATGGAFYTWSGGQILNSNSPTPLVFPDHTIRYVVNAHDANNCTAEDSVLVSVYKKSDVVVSGDTAICTGSSVQLHASGAFSYSWQPKNLVDSSSIASPLASPAVTTSFGLIANEGTHCEVKDSTTIFVHQKPVLDVGADTSVCSGDTVILSVSGASFYQWSPTQFLSNAQSNHPLAFPVSSTTFFVTGFDSIGCSNLDSIHVSTVAGPLANAGRDTSVCTGDTIRLHGGGGDHFLWEPSSLVSNDTLPNPFAFPTTSTDFVLLVNNGACPGRDTVHVTVNSLPKVSAGDNRNFCLKDTVQLHAQGAISYTWNPGNLLNDSTSSNPIAQLSINTTFILTGIDANGCVNKDTLMLSPDPPLQPSVISDTFLCAGTSVQLFAHGGKNYVWYPSTFLSDPDISNPVANPSTNIAYHVIISDGVCYSDTLGVHLLVDAPLINAGSDLTVDAGSSAPIILIASSGSILWQPSNGLSCDTCRQVTITPDSSRNYVVALTDFFGCKAEDTLHVMVSGGNVTCSVNDIFIPNVFTPNGNGKNDIFYARPMVSYELNYFRVFNRWGKMIFDSKDWQDGWDGNFENKPMPAGAYVYELEAVCSAGDVIRKQGTITLIR